MMRIKGARIDADPPDGKIEHWLRDEPVLACTGE
jgi:hypothetical protein